MTIYHILECRLSFAVSSCYRFMGLTMAAAGGGVQSRRVLVEMQSPHGRGAAVQTFACLLLLVLASTASSTSKHGAVNRGYLPEAARREHSHNVLYTLVAVFCASASSLLLYWAGQCAPAVRSLTPVI